MYKFKLISSAVAAAALFTNVLSAPIVERGTITGTNAGSIFRYGDAAAARLIFYQSGSCGLSTYFVGVVPDSMPLVAMPSTVMSAYGSSQYNTLCGKIVTITRSNGVTEQAAIADTNISNDNSIDMTSDLWVAFGQPANDGSIIPSLSWSVGDSSPIVAAGVASTSAAAAAVATTASAAATSAAAPSVATVAATSAVVTSVTATSVIAETPGAVTPATASSTLESSVTGTPVTTASETAASTTETSTSSSQTCSDDYKVVAGDTCWAIWTAGGFTESELRAWNPSLNAACDLDIGQTLCIGQPDSSSLTCSKQHKVVSGDTCWAIWTAGGFTEAELRAWNPSLDSACDLAIGQVLCLSN